MKPNMQEKLIFKGNTGGHYLIIQTRADAPSGYQAVAINTEAQSAQVVAKFGDELARSDEHLAYAKVLVNIKKTVNNSVVINALQKAIVKKELTVYKDIPKDITPGSEDWLSSTIGAFSSKNEKQPTSEAATDDGDISHTGSDSSDVKSETCVAGHETAADPVSMLTGEEILSLEDFTLPGLFPLVWRRLYRSSKIKTNTGLGFGWRHGFSLQLLERYQAPPKVGPKQPGTHWFELIDEEGTVHHFKRVKKGQTSYQPSSGLALLHEGEERQILVRADGTHWTFVKVESVWHLVSINNELGNELKLVYDNEHRLISIATAYNRGVILRYNSDNNINRIAPYIIDKFGKLQVSEQLLASYQYDNHQSLIAAINSQGAAEQYKYYAGALLKQRMRASGFSHYFEWDGQDEFAKCIRQWGDDDTYDYHFTFVGNKSTSTDSLGNTEQYFHNEQELLTRFIDANGNITTHEYDSQGRKTKTIDAMGQTTEFIYNNVGQLTKQIEADGSQVNHIYNAFGKRIATVDALGRQFKRHFNASGRLLSETSPDGRTSQYKYNDDGRLIEKAGDDGVCSHYKWNDNGELLAAQIGDTLTRYSYDHLGNVNAMCDAQDLITEYQRNANGQITQQVSYPQTDVNADNTLPDSAVITQYFYDKAGRLTNITSPNGDNTHYGYGGLAQPTKKVFADGSWLNYQYDKERNLIGIERSDEATYQIEYSPTEQPTKLVGFDGRVQSYDYDANDKLIAVNDADERIIHLKRDSLGRIIDQHSFTTQENKQAVFNNHNFYQYDKVGRVTLAHNSERVVQHQYHLNGQVSQSKQGDWVLDYQFNELGKRSRLILPDGQQINYQYNDRGQITFLIAEQYQGSKQIARERLVALEYNHAGQVVGQLQGNGIALKQRFDAHSRLTKQNWQGLKGHRQQRDYEYDKQNQLTQFSQQLTTQDKLEAQQATTFTYNKISQLVNSECVTSSANKQTEDFKWDAFGNPNVDYTIPKHERQTRIEQDRLMCFAGTDYSYDKSGNQIKCIATGQIQKRSFDGLNQLRKINNNDKLSQYEYDALGRRSAKITEAGRTDFIWDGNQLIGEVSNGQYTWYIYLPDSFEPIALIKNNQVYYYHLDQLGTPICLTDSQQQVVWENQGDLFGCEDKSEQGSLEPEKKNSIENPLRFQGQYFDAESGLHYNRFRYYCPKQGRFIHQDPIGLAGGINHYQYAPNPVNWIDPFGLCKEDGAGRSNMNAYWNSVANNAVTDKSPTTYLLAEGMKTLGNIGYGLSDMVSAAWNDPGSAGVGAVKSLVNLGPETFNFATNIAKTSMDGYTLIAEATLGNEGAYSTFRDSTPYNLTILAPYENDAEMGGAMLAGVIGGPVVAKYGKYNVEWAKSTPGVLNSNPIPIKITAPNVKLRELIDKGIPSSAATKFVNGQKLSPADFGVSSISSNPTAHKLWQDTLSKIVNSKRSNIYKRLLDDIDKGNMPVDKVGLNQKYSDAFSYVSKKFRSEANKQNIYVGDAIHHWNYNKGEYGTYVFHPDNLYPVTTQQHWAIHELTKSGQIYVDPILNLHELNLPSYTPLAIP